jgi:hypothetical protein
METKTTNSGIVYVLTNPAMPGMVKIGLTKRDTPEARKKELSNTAVPLPFDCEYACKVDDCKKVEDALHEAFQPYRVHPKREFFYITPEQAKPILELLGSDITKEFVDEISSDLSAEDKIAEENFRRKRPQSNFQEMNIPVGAKLVYTKGNNQIEVEVCSEKKVLYNGIKTSLTAVTKELLGSDRDVQPSRYWTYNGKNLLDIYNETYTNVE